MNLVQSAGKKEVDSMNRYRSFITAITVALVSAGTTTAVGALRPPPEGPKLIPKPVDYAEERRAGAAPPFRPASRRFPMSRRRRSRR